MTLLPLLISVPHAGEKIPAEVSENCVLSHDEIVEDGDVGAQEIYSHLEEITSCYLSTDIARAIVDLNRSSDEIGGDGVIKSHTCWNVQVYKDFPAADTIDELLKNYYFPYHRKLTEFAKTKKVVLAIDCHTMADKAPPFGPTPGEKRPMVCLSNGEGTCPDEWIFGLAEIIRKQFNCEVRINSPFRGGFITRSHAVEIPWLQLEISRSKNIPLSKKRDLVLQSLSEWSEQFSVI